MIGVAIIKNASKVRSVGTIYKGIALSLQESGKRRLERCVKCPNTLTLKEFIQVQLVSTQFYVCDASPDKALAIFLLDLHSFLCRFARNTQLLIKLPEEI